LVAIALGFGAGEESFRLRINATDALRLGIVVPARIIS
jgi:hypothetical protein